MKTNTKAKPSKPSKPAQDWAAGLDALAQVVQRESFQPTQAAFQHAPLVPVSHGPAFISRASVRAKDGASQVLVRVPDALTARLAAHTVAPKSVALAALADWALDHLLATGQQLTTTDKKDG